VDIFRSWPDHALVHVEHAHAYGARGAEAFGTKLVWAKLASAAIRAAVSRLSVFSEIVSAARLQFSASAVLFA
jgi:hypothetical protein